jgi:hypothetical protein
MTLKQRVLAYDTAHRDPQTVAMRVYLHDKAYCSSIDDGLLFRLRDMLSLGLRVPIGAVALTGSGQIGWSVSRRLPFNKSASDLDFSIIDALSFQSALEDVVKTTRAYTDQTSFVHPDHPEQFQESAARGIIRPDLLPRCQTRTDWLTLGNQISQAAAAMAKSASFAVYLSEPLFVGKQQSALNVVRRYHP